MNLPNTITMLRLAITFVYFAILAVAIDLLRSSPDSAMLLVDISLAVFLIAAISDLLDGYLARKYGEETDFGRVADPFVDKVLICGSFILLLSFQQLDGLLSSWMVVVVVSRELIIHALRALLESRKIAFGATFWGKQKMVIQCVAIAGALLYISHLSQFGWMFGLLKAIVWGMLLSTVVSGLVYAAGAAKYLRESGGE